MINIDNHGKGFSEVLEETERIAIAKGLDEKMQTQIRMLTEETMEMLKNISDEFEAELSAEIENGQFELRIYSKTRMDSDKRERLHDIVNGDVETREVSGKIRAILSSRYYDESEKGENFFEEMGIQRVEAGEIENGESNPGEAEYVWSLQNYGFATFDRQEEPGNDRDWAEIGRSIIANLADDINIYIFRDHMELVVTKQVEDIPEHQGEWDIDPELEELKKIPVATSRLQVRMIQLLYGGLMKKEKSDDALTVKRIRIPCDESPKNRLDCLVYEPKGKEHELLPAVLLLHGGALVFPAFPYHYRLARYVAEHTDSRVFLPNYDLAPDFKPPIQYREAFKIYRYLLEKAGELLIDPSRVVIMGDSAGGTMCATLCLVLKSKGMPMPAGQVLLYPSLDSRLNSRSMKMYTDVPVINSRAVREYYKLCSSRFMESSSKNGSPVEAESLEGMPPTYVETAEFDCLHDDGVLYADRLSKDHCEVVLNETKGTVHAYDMAKDSTVVMQALESRTRFINELFYPDGE